jgi:endonuclease G
MLVHRYSTGFCRKLLKLNAQRKFKPSREVNMSERRKRILQSGSGFIPIDFDRVDGKTEFLQVNFLSRGAMASKAVCQLIVLDVVNGKLVYGTGFLITPRLLITNHHVISTKEQAADTRVIFDKERNAYGTWEKRKEFRLDPEGAFITNEELDYSIIAIQEKSLRGNFETKQFNFLRLIPDLHKIEESENVSVIQHPEEGNVSQKYIAVRAGRVLKIGKNESEDDDEIEDKYLWYSAETLRGSSGSPVLNDQWQVVAIHHRAVPETKTMKGELYYRKTNRRWVKIKGDANDYVNAYIVANQGVRTSVIVKDVEEKLSKLEYVSEIGNGKSRELLNEFLDDVKTETVKIKGFTPDNSIGIFIPNGMEKKLFNLI